MGTLRVVVRANCAIDMRTRPVSADAVDGSTRRASCPSMKVDDRFDPFAERALLVRLARSYGVRDEEDVVQEALLVFHRRRGEVAPGAERAFLAGVTRRIALRAKMRATRFVPVDELEVEDEGDGVEARLAEAREHAVVRDALVRLSPEDRTVFELFERDGLTKIEVAAALGIPEIGRAHV